MSIEVRRLQNQDINQVVELWKDLVKGHQKQESCFPKKVSTTNYKKLLKQSIGKKNACPLVAVKKDRIVGYLFLFYNLKKKEMRFRNFFVKPHYRKKGVGGMLVDEALVWAKKNKIQKIGFQVWHFNDRALNFWFKKGGRELYREMIIEL